MKNIGISGLFRVFRNSPQLVVYLYFLIFGLFFVFFIQLGTAPDEIYHYTFMQHFAQNSADPFLDKQNTDFILGATTTEVSYLYHYLMSLVYRAGEVAGLNEVVLIRLANLALAIASLVTLNKIGEALRIRTKIRVAALFAIASIPMFIFLSSSINYDNLMILGTALSILLTLKLNQSFSISKLALLSALTMLGLIVKMAYIPIAVVMIGFIVYQLIINRGSARKQVSRLYSHERMKLFALLILVICSLFFTSYKYVGNLITYKQINPACQKTLVHQECMQNPIYARTEKYSQQQPQKKPVGPDRYVVSWVNLMVNRTYGLFGHQKFTSVNYIIYLAIAAAYLLIIFFLRKITWKSFKRTIIPTLFIVYTSALLYTNYKSYALRGDIALAVQGRYLLPVLLPLILFVVHLYNQTLQHKTRQNLFLALIIIFSIATGPLHALKGIDSSWLTHQIW